MKKLLIAALLLSSCLGSAAFADQVVKPATGSNFNTCTTLISTTDITCVQLKSAAGTLIDPATAGGQATGNGSLATIATNSGLFVDTPGTGTIPAGTLNATYALSLPSNAATVSFTLTGMTASGATVTLEASNDGAITWTPASYFSTVTGLGSTATIDSQFRVDVGGRRNLRLRVSTIGTGTISVASNISSALSGIVYDPWNAPYQGEVAMTVGTAYTAARSLKAVCSIAGNVNVTYADGSTGTWTINAVGTTVLPVAATTVNSSGTTATCTYSNMK